MKEQLELIKQNALAALDAAETPAALEELRVKLLGKKGELTAVLKMMGKLSPEERPVMGQMANAVRAEIEAKLDECKASIGAKVLEAKLAAEAIDVTIPGETVELWSIWVGVDQSGTLPHYSGRLKDFDMETMEQFLKPGLENGAPGQCRITITI